MTRKVLGRGLSALLSETPATSSEELREVDIDLIEPNNVQPRTRFDETQLEELAQSIKTNGVVQPILVRKTNGGRYQIVAGERRWRAAQRAGLQRIPSVIRDVPDDKMLELALIENIQRQELNAIEEAYAYKRLIETFNLTQETVAQRVGRDRTFVTNYLRLLRLPEDIQLLVEESKLSMGHARALLGIDNADKQREIARGIIERSLSVRDTERAVKRVAAGGESNPAAATTSSDRSGDANTRAAESKLRRRLGTQVHIIPNPSGDGGKIEVQYYNEADLQRVYELVMGAQNTLGDV
ncbi:MAG: ParB family transcriptional regulator, chromosome partitioning protein [Pyrinomonadaceae bacterium]|jgi:ParB family chromosome partitioning protein|nr:ParB family transcriptional regulator, chromosome partitioning protein [Pyrinomonadaceae bacterium]